MPPEDARAGAPDDALHPEEWLEVYTDLRKLASRHLRRYSQRTLSTTTLVHEAYIRLARSPDLEFNDLDHYLHTASQAMRWILVESTRESLQKKRGGKWARVDLDATALEVGSEDQEQEELMTLNRALRKLLEVDRRGAHVVVMRSLGMSVDEISDALAVSPRTVSRDWKHGVHWLYRELAESKP